MSVCNTCEVPLPDRENSQSESTVAKVKIINPKNRGGYVVKDWNFFKDFSSVKNLKSVLGISFVEYVQGDFDIGYITPCHDVRGKLVALASDSDLATMQAVYKEKKPILLWVM